MENQKKHKLLVQKDRNYYNNKWLVAIRFCIIDSSKIYPLSYVCGLSGRCFDEIFKDVDKVQFALSLLNEALANPEYLNDPDIKTKIEKRIALLTPQTSTISCRACSSPFQPKSKYHRYCAKCKATFFKPEMANCGFCGSLFEVHGKTENKRLYCKDCRKEHKTQKTANYQKPKQENTHYTSKKNLIFLPRNVIEAFKEGFSNDE